MLSKSLQTFYLFLKTIIALFKVLTILILISIGVLVFYYNAHAAEMTNEEALQVEQIKLRASDILYSEEKAIPIYDGISEVIDYKDVVDYAYLGNEIDGSMALFEQDNQYSFVKNLGDNQYQVFGEPIYYKNDNGQVHEILNERVSKTTWDAFTVKTTVEKIEALLKTPYVYAASYVASSDDSIRATNKDWATAHDATTGIMRDSTQYLVGSYLWENDTYFCERAFLNFNTSAFGDSDTIGTSSLFIYVQEKYSNVQNTYTAYGSTAGDTVVADDYNNFGTTTLSSSINHNDISNGSWQELVLNNDGKANINKTGISKFSIREGNYDVANTAPVGMEARMIIITDNSGSNKPYLIVNLAQPENPTSTSTLNVITCDSLAWNQKCSIVGYQYASGTTVIATTTEITTYQFLNLFYMIFELFVCALIILGLIKYKF